MLGRVFSVWIVDAVTVCGPTTAIPMCDGPGIVESADVRGDEPELQREDAQHQEDDPRTRRRPQLSRQAYSVITMRRAFEGFKVDGSRSVLIDAHRRARRCPP